MEHFSRNNAFTLVEIMVVLAIIGLLSALGIPQMREMQKSAMQAEPKMMLSQLRVLQESHLAENGVYVRNINTACGGSPQTCNNRIAVTRTNEAFYDPEVATETGCMLPGNNNPASNNYHIARLGFRVTDCRRLRYFYASNGYFNVAREIGTSVFSEDRRVFPGCTDRFDTWVLTNNKELRHSGHANNDHNYQTTQNGYDANTMCRN